MEHKRRVYISALRGPALAAGTEIVAVSIDLTRQKVRETNLLDAATSWTTRVHCPQWFTNLSSPMVGSWAAEYVRAGGPGREHADGGTR